MRLPARLGVVAAVITVLVLGAGLATIELRARSSTSCTERCHTEIESSHAGHEEVACRTCHTVSPTLARSLVWRAAWGDVESSPPHGSVDDASCKDCHATTLVASDGHRIHATDKAETTCITCHGAGEHAPVGAEARCVECHAEAPLHDPPIEDRCTDCHTFALSGAAATVQACGTCHGGDQQASWVVDESVLHGEVDCASCHNPHTAAGVQAPRSFECSRCHEIDVAGEGPAGHQACAGCHPPHAVPRSAVASCANCHAAQVRGMTTALKHDDCSSCHVPHRWVAARAGCHGCHGDTVAQMTERAPKGHGNCDGCHQPHEPPPTAATCIGCHEPMKAKAALAPSGHQKCAGCHDPHGDASSAKGACDRCHGPIVSEVAATKLAGHIEGGCRTCHGAHGDPATVQTTCERCHKKQGVAAARAEPTEHRRCSSCHGSHLFAIMSGKTEEVCASCHETLVATAAVHKGDCKPCHTPHGPPEVTATACVDCHKEVDAAAVQAQGHVACDGCHAPHLPAAGALARCGSCHAREARVATTWPRASPHEASCASCHKGHDVHNGPRCSDCHVSEALQARKGKHQCIQCHAPHRATPSAIERKAGGWWLRCAGCHTSQALATETRGRSHSRCSSCHSPHEKKIAGCKSCHRDMISAGLHGLLDHRGDCKLCHATHEKSDIGRGTCLACHADQKTHKPDSPRCWVCHVFSP